MNKTWLPWAIVGGVVVLIVMLAVGTYNSLVADREKVTTAFSNVQTQYQRRADLIPNLVNIVEGASDFEQETLTQVIDARAKATSISIDASTATPEDVQKFMDAQNGVTGSLSRLLAVAESYPELKSVVAYQDLMTQLEGTENRIQIARSDYNEVARPFNTRVQTFPTNIFAGIFGFTVRPYFEASTGSEMAPTIEFGN
ncbi:LemA family protein [Candidatus Saccharibacteria bacterium]|nr:LemA family protein [Candidatus Saccharibacteria bacterium]